MGRGLLSLVLASAAAPPPPPTDVYRPVRGPSAPAEYRYLQKTLPGESIPRHAHDLAAAEARELPTVDKRWKGVGPTSIGGRIVSLALDPNRADTLYAAAASGGLWRSTDAGETFHSVWPDSWTQAMGAVATAPDGTLYVGTGEPNPGGGSITYEGTGLCRSKDGGRTWTPIGLRDSGAINAITIDPANPRRIYVVAAGSPYNGGGDRGVYRSEDGGGDRGVYRSEDGGATWERILAGANEFTGATEIVLDGDRMYAVLWDKRRRPDLRTYGGEGSGVFRSTDGGETWQPISPDLSGGPGPDPICTNYGTITSIAPASDGRTVYAGTDDGRVWVTRDLGATWTKLAEGRPWVTRVVVDPKNPNRVPPPRAGRGDARAGCRRARGAR